MKIAYVPGYYVVREILPSGERAWRISSAGEWSHSPDHKNNWLSIKYMDVPLRITEALLKHFDETANDLHAITAIVRCYIASVDLGDEAKSSVILKVLEYPKEGNLHDVARYVRDKAIQIQTFTQAIRDSILLEMVAVKGESA